MIVNKYNQGGGGSGSGVTPQDVQQQIDSALTPYWESAETQSAITEAVSGLASEEYVQEALSGVSLEGYWDSAQTQDAISAATSGKADAASVSANTNTSRWPAWNEQGIITGTVGNVGFETQLVVNGSGWWFWQDGNSKQGPKIYAPTNAGTAGDILVSTGNGAPVWSAVTFPDVSNYVTSADVKTQIEAYNYMDSTDAQVISTALVDLNDRVAIISAATPTVDLSGYYTSAQTEQAITSKNYVTSAQVETQITNKNYALSADVTTLVNSAFSYTNEIERVTASAYTELHDGLMEVSGRPVFDSSAYYTSAQTEAAITGKNYVTSAQTDNAIADALTSYTPTTGFATVNGSAITNGGNLVIQGGGGDMSAYWTSAQTESALTSVSGNLQDQIDTMDTVVSDAINDLNARFNILSANTVTSQTIRSIMRIEQTAYDTLVAQSATSQTTLYVVVPDAQ